HDVKLVGRGDVRLCEPSLPAHIFKANSRARRGSTLRRAQSGNQQKGRKTHKGAAMLTNREQPAPWLRVHSSENAGPPPEKRPEKRPENHMGNRAGRFPVFGLSPAPTDRISPG